MWITIEQITCLKAINDLGSINSASEHLNKAKSAVSYSISRLEEQVGFPVLDRSQYRISLTPQGAAFLLKAKNLLGEMENLKAEVHKIASGVEMRLSISASAIYPMDQLNQILKDLILEFPSTEITFHREILSGERMLLNDMVDIAIFESLQNSMDIDAKKIGEVDLKLVVCKNHPLFSLPKKHQSLETLAKYPHIIQRSTIDDPTTMGSPEGAARWTVSDIASKKDLILNNYGWGRLPDHFVKKEIKNGTLVHLKNLKYDHCLDVFLCKKKTRDVGPVLRRIWDYF